MSCYIAPYDGNLIMQSVAFIFAITSLYNAQFSLTLIDPTFLEAIFIAFLHR
jgi:hypothetical protein